MFYANIYIKLTYKMNNNELNKHCVVPMCNNTTINTPQKIFIDVPRNKRIREKWFKIAKIDPASLHETNKYYYCEDHFDLQSDMENYIAYTKGSVSKIRMRPGCTPSKFDCQPNRNSHLCILTPEHKRKLDNLIEQCEKELGKKIPKLGKLEKSDKIFTEVLGRPNSGSSQIQQKESYKCRSNSNQTKTTSQEKQTLPFKLFTTSTSIFPLKILQLEGQVNMHLFQSNTANSPTNYIKEELVSDVSVKTQSMDQFSSSASISSILSKASETASCPYIKEEPDSDECPRDIKEETDSNDSINSAESCFIKEETVLH